MQMKSKLLRAQGTRTLPACSAILVTMGHCSSSSPDEKVGTWMPIHLEALDRWKSVNKKNLKNNRHISELADWYVFTKAGCLRERMSIQTICDQCCAFQPQDTAEVQLTAILTAKLADDPETLKLVLVLLQQDR
jgi:hypothetical protein